MRSPRYRYTDNILIITLFFLIFLPVSSARSLMIDGIVAVVDEKIIMYSDLQNKIKDLGGRLEDRETWHQVLQLMVEDIIVEKVYRSLGLPAVELSEAQDFAARTGLDIASATTMVMKTTLMEIMVKSRVVVTETMIQTYYENNDAYTGRESLRLKQILTRDNREKAQRALDEIREGGDFDEVARSYSDVIGSGGTDIGWIAINQLSPVAKDALSGAEPGDIIGPIDTGGFTIIYKVMEKGRVGMKGLDEARDEITRILEEQSRQEAFEHWLRMIMAEHFIGMYL
ncbi:MAG TPA: hypothetical protein ENN34_09910 [Deltaproteobacteria bacterium]|nr:hypothetical protein [Deltaproteobacteria bacterium]